jgi:hypothetical protein
MPNQKGIQNKKNNNIIAFMGKYNHFIGLIIYFIYDLSG